MTFKYFLLNNNTPEPIYIRIKDGSIFDIKVNINSYITPTNWNQNKEQPSNLKEADNKKN